MYYVKDGYKVIKDNNELGYILLLKQANITVFLPLSYGLLCEANSYLNTNLPLVRLLKSMLISFQYVHFN